MSKLHINQRRAVEACTIMVVTSNAMSIRNLPEYKDHAYGYNALQLCVEALIEMETLVGSDRWNVYLLLAKQLVRDTAPSGYDYYPPLRKLSYGYELAKLVVNGNWLPDRRLTRIGMLVQELYNGQSIEGSAMAVDAVEKSYRQIRSRGYFTR